MSYAAFSLALIALMPLAASLKPFNITMSVNDVQTVFKFSGPVLFIELRVYPVMGALLMLSAGALQLIKKNGLKQSEPLFFVGFGFMSYSLFRFVLLECYDGIPQWMNFWEEITEMILIVLLAYFLYVFRRHFKFLKS